MSSNYREHDRRIWESIFLDVPPDWFEAPPSPVMARCATFLHERGARAILDLGCGIGRWSIFLAGEGLRGVVGIDYALGGVNTALRWSRRTSQRASYACADGTRLPFGPGSFDAVVAALVFESFSRSDLARVLEDLDRITAPGSAGFFLFNPHFTAEELAQPEQTDNPTKACSMEMYDDAEIERVFQGWRILSFETCEHNLRVVEAVRSDL